MVRRPPKEYPDAVVQEWATVSKRPRPVKAAVGRSEEAVAALALIQIVLPVVVATDEIATGRLSWPPFLFLVAGLIVLAIERRRPRLGMAH